MGKAERGFQEDRLQKEAINVAIRRRYPEALEVIFLKAGHKITVTKDQLDRIYDVHMELCECMIKGGVKIKRKKSSIIKLLQGYFESYEHIHEIFKQGEELNLIDVLSTMIDKKAAESKILSFLENSSSECTYDEIIAMLILRGQHDLVRSYLSKKKGPYNPIWAKIAIESDNFDCAFLIKAIYPQSFTAKEKQYLNPVLAAFQKSNSNWLIKMYLLKSLLSHTSYSKAEQFLLHVLKSLEREDPASNPLYYAPNVVLFV